jgi:2-methylcitrate dehydratase PrpD
MHEEQMEETNINRKKSQEKTSTERVAEFITSVKYDDIPAPGIVIAKKALLDWLGVSIAGSIEPGARIFSDYAWRSDSRKEAAVIGQGFKTIAEFAALANGNIGHTIDFDDTLPDKVHYNMHPSACIMPAVLALTEKNQLSGRQMLTSYVVGMEIIYRLGAVIGEANSRIGWHPTPVIGTIGAAAACANLLGLNQLQVQYALGISASLAGGLTLNFGSMTKPLHAGNAARNGVFAAELASEGFTGNSNVLDGDYSFCSLFGGKSIVGLLGQENDLGKEWRLVSIGIGFKYYPSCRSTHTSIDAAIFLRNKYNIKIDQIDKVTCKINPHHLNIARFIKPETGYQGKFSIPYCITTALRNGNITLTDFSDDRVMDKEIQDIISKTKFIPAAPVESGVVELAAEITVLLDNGQKYSHLVSFPTGEPENPMTEEALASKFESCSSLVLDKGDIKQLLKLVNSFDIVKDLTPLFNIIIKK